MNRTFESLSPPVRTKTSSNIGFQDRIVDYVCTIHELFTIYLLSNSTVRINDSLCYVSRLRHRKECYLYRVSSDERVDIYLFRGLGISSPPPEGEGPNGKYVGFK